jgi:large subunit ribosomal protein L28
MRRGVGGKCWELIRIPIGDYLSPKTLFFFVILIRFPYLCRPKFLYTMARVCQVTGKVPVTGNKVSHSNIKTKRRFLPNLQTKRFFLAEEDKWITLKLTTEGIRTINKRGLYSVVKELRANGTNI